MDVVLGLSLPRERVAQFVDPEHIPDALRGDGVLASLVQLKGVEYSLLRFRFGNGSGGDHSIANPGEGIVMVAPSRSIMERSLEETPDRILCSGNVLIVSGQYQLSDAHARRRKNNEMKFVLGFGIHRLRDSRLRSEGAYKTVRQQMERARLLDRGYFVTVFRLPGHNIPITPAAPLIECAATLRMTGSLIVRYMRR